MWIASSFLVLFMAGLAAAANPKVVAAAQVITAHYDDLDTSFALLGGSGNPITNPYMRLNYSPKVTVIALEEELLAGVSPPSGDNCIQVLNITRYTYNRIFTKISDDDNFTLRGFSFACAYEVLGEAEPLPCELQISCAYNSLSGNSADKFINYTGTSDFQPVNTKYENLRSCAFTLHRVGTDGNYSQPVTVLFDDFRYSIFTDPPE